MPPLWSARLYAHLWNTSSPSCDPPRWGTSRDDTTKPPRNRLACPAAVSRPLCSSSTSCNCCAVGPGTLRSSHPSSSCKISCRPQSRGQPRRASQLLLLRQVAAAAEAAPPQRRKAQKLLARRCSSCHPRASPHPRWYGRRCSGGHRGPRCHQNPTQKTTCPTQARPQAHLRGSRAARG